MHGRNSTNGNRPVFALRMTFLTMMLLIMFGAIAWMVHRTWRQSDAVRARIQRVNKVSAWLGHQMSDAVHLLDTRMLRFKLGINPGEWERFQNELAELREWTSKQRVYLETAGERLLLAQIDRELEGYESAAHTFAGSTEAIRVPDEVTAQITELSIRSKALVDLGMKLGNAHQATVDHMLDAVSREHAQLQWSTYVALSLMLCAGSGMGWLVYRDSIAPLRRRLVESNRELARQEKLAALGELAAGIAHEIRNPITAIKARLFTLRKSVSLDPPALEDATMINGEIDRLERIVRDFLRFARPPEPRCTPVDPLDMLRKIRDLVQPQFAGSPVKIELDETTAPPVSADSDLIEQALLNLVQNAADAISESGKTGMVRLAARAGLHPSELRGGRGVRLEVHDDGPGIPADIQGRLFDPFFTTKASGTGLGLSLTARIVEKHGGRVECNSTPGRGTTFALVLPAA
ncbi:MAG TPA: ATP-binding protein [Opitutaceae bacterium]